MDTSLNTIKMLLKRETGLDSETVGEATIKKFLDQRMRACKLVNIDDYCNLVITDKNELAALLETAVIPETWFFRDIRPFKAILNAIRNKPGKYSGKPCNILCIPCSTGEEPYSVAMYLLQESIQATDFRIKAVDISRQALDIAALGYYGSNSFRGKIAPGYIEHFFTPENGQYLINNKIRQCISFSRLNILDASSLDYNNYFDFILCRNLLIYFDITTKMVAFNNLHKMLKDDGVLFIGHSEFGAVPKDLFFNTGSNNAFGLIKYRSLQNRATIPIPTPIPAPPVFSQNISNKATKKTASQTLVTSEIKTPLSHDTGQTEKSEGEQDYLVRARQLADEGSMHDAEEYCLRHIEKHGGQCESFFLLALINESSGKNKLAEDFYRKAIYLNPKHYHSLIHLALLLENTGDKKSAALLKQRAERTLKN